MNAEQLRIAIAERVGLPEAHWWCPKCEREKSPVQVTYEEACTLCGSLVIWNEAPDYTRSLDAVHEAEKVLTDEEWPRYAMHLHHITLHDRMFSVITATALQRAVALGLTWSLLTPEQATELLREGV